ncbi:hypothetical protein NSK_004337 [Nannochloropsis salina CCMP1776]|uniref:EamA domain-containing protein n=1 Tax=Nannochloropsis salina CCMP1776 TaxID=1027361 RepID=A0A4D9D6Z1_9STRA|nr:hypothetical protein NSK_004337 [Nannochloropsis salina CCMP1776]|eukprot:TFJ84349.1 hypothetical protein NSK_004337 [Nannochloropsis salina CCMP1776]
MVFGAVLAGLADLSFDPVGYLFIFGNNIFTALNGVIMKRTLTSSNISKMAVLYYNSLFGAVFMTTLLFCRPRELQAIKNFPSLKDPTFLIVFFLAAGTGSILNYATFLCTHHNSALTTTVVGCLKNLATTYFSMFFLPDYVFSWSNFWGVTVSVAGSVIYSYIELVKQGKNARSKASDSSVSGISSEDRGSKRVSQDEISDCKIAESPVTAFKSMGFRIENTCHSKEKAS